MELITQRKLIQGVAAAWGQQYRHYSEGDKRDITIKLEALDGNTATPEDVANIIGNKGWTSIKCDECGRVVIEAVRMGEEPDYESHTAHLCLQCLVNALGLIERAMEFKWPFSPPSEASGTSDTSACAVSSHPRTPPDPHR